MPDRTVVYTDGACLGNPGPGGWAWAVPGGAHASGPAAETTNQRMELTAALEAVRSLDGPLEVVSDSTYVVNCFRDRWWEGWLRRGWQTSKKQPVANRDLWEPLVAAVRQRGDVTFRWVKGHGDDPVNDLVDRLAVEAATTQRGRSGDRPPADVGPADDAVRAGGGGAGGTGEGGAAGDPRVPAGRRVVVTGHRPAELGGYGDTPAAAAVRRRLEEIFAAKAELEPDTVVVTALGLGAEQLGAEAAAAAGVPYVAVLAFPGVDQRWPDPARDRFRELLAGAREVVVLERKVPDTPQKVAGSFRRRDAWLARHADEAVVVWDGADELVGRQARALEERVGADLWIVEPPAEA